MKGLFLKIYNSGVEEGMTYSFQRRVIVSNLLGITMVFSSLFLSFVFTLMIDRPVVAGGAAVSAFLFGMVPWLNSKGLFKSSRLVISLYGPLAIFVFSMWGRIIAPDELEINQYYVPRILLMSMFCAPFVLFELREWKMILVVCLVTLSFLLGFDYWQQLAGFGFLDRVSEIDLSTYYNFNYVMFISTVIMALAFIYLIKVNDQYEVKVLNLYEEVKEKEQDLIKAKEVAEESAVAKSQFLSNMSHEIRTPLNAVIGLTNLLDNGELSPEQQENLEILKFSSENLMNIINDVLDFSKIDAGKLDLEYTNLNIRELAQRLVLSFKLKAEEKGIEMHLHVADDVPRLLVGDPVRLSQIFGNLISNAIKFTEEGSVTVAIRLDRIEEDHCFIYVEVTDTGIGIAVDKQKLIFDSFSQADLETTRKYGGTGLGLAITKQLLLLHGSELHLSSEVGKGAKFYFTLPLKVSESNVADVVETSPNGFVGLEGRKILLVEDNLVNQKIARKFLEKWGVEVDIANDGSIAIEMVQQADYDLILMDLQMPNMDGYEASRKIRSMGGGFEEIPIIALTASAMMEIRQRAYDAGMNDYVSKPFNPKELFRKIAAQVTT